MTDWIKHDTDLAEQAYQQWVDEGMQGDDVIGVGEIAARLAREANQNLIDAARLEGIWLGLEAAAGAADDGADYWRSAHKDGRYLEGRTDGLGEAAVIIRNLDPETIAREAKPTA